MLHVRVFYLGKLMKVLRSKSDLFRVIELTLMLIGSNSHAEYLTSSLISSGEQVSNKLARLSRTWFQSQTLWITRAKMSQMALFLCVLIADTDELLARISERILPCRMSEDPRRGRVGSQQSCSIKCLVNLP
jgi:hypothetical protein